MGNKKKKERKERGSNRLSGCNQFKDEAKKKEQEHKMNKLKKWVNEEIDGDFPKLSDRELVWFLKGGEFDLDESKNLILASYKLKKLRPKIFTDRDPLDPDIRAVWNIVYMVRMPLKSNCQLVVYIGLKNADPKKFDMVNTEKLFHMCVDMMVETGDLEDTDFIMVLDGKGVTLRHFSLHNLPQIKLALAYFQKGVPLTMNEIHIINSSSMIRKIYFLAKPFIDKRFAEKLTFHGTDHNLSKVIQPSMLPYELGGTYGTLDQIQDLMRESLEKFRYWFTQYQSESRKVVISNKN